MGLFGAIGGPVSPIAAIQAAATSSTTGLASTAGTIQKAGLLKIGAHRSLAAGLPEGEPEANPVMKLQRVAQEELGDAGTNFKDGIGIISGLELPASTKQLAGKALADPSLLGGVSGPIANAPNGLKGILNDSDSGAVFGVTHFSPSSRVMTIATAGVMKNGIPTFA